MLEYQCSSRWLSIGVRCLGEHKKPSKIMKQLLIKNKNQATIHLEMILHQKLKGQKLSHKLLRLSEICKNNSFMTKKTNKIDSLIQMMSTYHLICDSRKGLTRQKVEA